MQWAPQIDYIAALISTTDSHKTDRRFPLLDHSDWVKPFVEKVYNPDPEIKRARHLLKLRLT